MAATTRVTNEVTNFQSTPKKLTDPQHAEAKLHMAEVTMEVAVADATGAIYGLLWVHKSWSIKDIRRAHDAVNSGSDIDLGLYSSPNTPSSADLNAADSDGDHDVYGAAHDLSSATTAWTSMFNRDPALVKQQVWQDAGAASYDAAKEWYLLALTCNFEPAAVDTISIQVAYTKPGGA